MIHNSKLIDCADALHNIQHVIDLLKISSMIGEFYSQEMFSLTHAELVQWLTTMAIAELEENVTDALHSIDFKTINEIRLEYRAMQECNSRSGDEKSAVNSSDG